MIYLSCKSDWGDEVVIEDDGRVCYAYLYVNETIVSDVWLYNGAIAPDIPEWYFPDAKDIMPFRNPKAYISEIPFPPIESEHEIRIVFGELGDKLEAAIHIRGQFHALLREGDKPGYCSLALEDGPLAKHLPQKRT